MSAPEDSSWIIFHTPTDRNLLAAMGEVSIAHGQLDHVLRMTIKSLTNVTLSEALDATVSEGSSMLRDRIRRLGRQRLGEGVPLVKLQAYMKRFERVTRKRNDLTHSLFAQHIDGEPLMRSNESGWQPLPSADELSALAQEIRALTVEFNTERLNGFLSHALAIKKIGD